MLFSALYVVISFFQHLSGNIGYFTFLGRKTKKSTGFIRFFDMLRRQDEGTLSAYEHVLRRDLHHRREQYLFCVLLITLLIDCLIDLLIDFSIDFPNNFSESLYI